MALTTSRRHPARSVFALAVTFVLSVAAQPAAIVTADDGSASVVVDGAARSLNVEPALQRRLQALVHVARPRRGAVVFADVDSGRVLAIAEHDEVDPAHASAALRPLAHAASVYKLVTMSALLRNGIDLDETICTSGGVTRISSRDLRDAPWRDTRCVAVENAVPWSQNVVMAKLTGRHLTPQLLIDESERFGLVVADGDSAAPPDPPPVTSLSLPSFAVIPDDDLQTFVKTGAGFGEVRLSGLDAVRVARTVATGEDAPLLLFSDDAPTFAKRRVLDDKQQKLLTSMMLAATTRGTATRALHGSIKVPKELRGQPWTVDVAIAGKTGTITDREVDEDTTWLMGFFPAQDPQVAFAVVVINDEWLWYVRALELARASLATYLELHPELKTKTLVQRSTTAATTSPSMSATTTMQ